MRLEKVYISCNYSCTIRRMVLVKIFDHYHHKFQLFQLPCKIVKNSKLKFRSKFNHDRNLTMVLLIMDICTVLFEMFYTILRQKDPRR